MALSFFDEAMARVLPERAQLVQELAVNSTTNTTNTTNNNNFQGQGQAQLPEGQAGGGSNQQHPHQAASAAQGSVPQAGPSNETGLGLGPGFSAAAGGDPLAAPFGYMAALQGASSEAGGQGNPEGPGRAAELAGGGQLAPQHAEGLGQGRGGAAAGTIGTRGLAALSSSEVQLEQLEAVAARLKRNVAKEHAAHCLISDFLVGRVLTVLQVGPCP